MKNAPWETLDSRSFYLPYAPAESCSISDIHSDYVSILLSVKTYVYHFDFQTVAKLKK